MAAYECSILHIQSACLRETRGRTWAVFIHCFFETGWNSGCIHNIVCLRQGGGTLAVLSHTNTGWIYTNYGYPIDSEISSMRYPRKCGLN